jgi:hypothetical protein
MVIPQKYKKSKKPELVVVVDSKVVSMSEGLSLNPNMHRK